MVAAAAAFSVSSFSLCSSSSEIKGKKTPPSRSSLRRFPPSPWLLPPSPSLPKARRLKSAAAPERTHRGACRINPPMSRKTLLTSVGLRASSPRATAFAVRISAFTSATDGV